MPKTFGGIVGWAISTVVVVGVGIFILSRVRPVWRVIVAPQA